MASERKNYLYGNPKAKNWIIEPIDAQSLREKEKEIKALQKLNPEDNWCVVGVVIDDWQWDLTPWHVYDQKNNLDFGNGGKRTLNDVTKELIPELKQSYRTQKPKRFYLAGYSLAGLFAMWSAYQTDCFDGVAAVSPSLWYPGWEDYAEKHQIKTPRVYLSLGDKEAKTKNPVMATVEKAVSDQYERLRARGVRTTFAMNKGNHFKNADVRMAKGISWLIND